VHPGDERLTLRIVQFQWAQVSDHQQIDRGILLPEPGERATAHIGDDHATGQVAKRLQASPGAGEDNYEATTDARRINQDGATHDLPTRDPHPNRQRSPEIVHHNRDVKGAFCVGHRQKGRHGGRHNRPRLRPERGCIDNHVSRARAGKRGNAHLKRKGHADLESAVKAQVNVQVLERRGDLGAGRHSWRQKQHPEKRGEGMAQRP
jgi:hypothetical protein